MVELADYVLAEVSYALKVGSYGLDGHDLVDHQSVILFSSGKALVNLKTDDVFEVVDVVSLGCNLLDQFRRRRAQSREGVFHLLADLENEGTKVLVELFS
jgi:hypothetical protein